MHRSRPVGPTGWLAALLLLLLTALPSYAAAPLLDVEQALRLAAQGHPARQLAALADELATSGARAARWPAAPRLELEQEGLPGDPGGVIERRVGVTQELPAPPVWWLEGRLARARGRETRLEGEALAAELERSVREAHLEAWVGQERERLSSANAELAASWAAQLERLVEAGLRPAIEARQARAEALSAELAREAARGEARIAARRLAGALGLDGLDAPLAPPPLEARYAKDESTLAERRAEAALASAVLERRAVAWSRWPAFELGAARILPAEDGVEAGWGLSLGLSLPLLDGAAAGERRRTRLFERRSRAERDWSALESSLELEELRERLDAEGRRLSWMEAERLPLLVDLAQAMARAYETGAARAVDVLDARRQAIEAELEALETRAACARHALQLDAALGRRILGASAEGTGDAR